MKCPIIRAIFNKYDVEYYPGLVMNVMNFFDEGMARLKSNGELQVIMDKYGLEDWQKYLK